MCVCVCVVCVCVCVCVCVRACERVRPWRRRLVPQNESGLSLWRERQEHEERAAEGKGGSQEVRKQSDIFACHLERRETGKSAERDRKKDRLDKNTNKLVKTSTHMRASVVPTLPPPG